MPSIEAFHAVTRFGLGANANDLANVTDPRGWLSAQLQKPVIPMQVREQPDDRSAILARAQTKKITKNTKNKKNKPRMEEQGETETLRHGYAEASYARFRAQLATPQPFIERLVMFWSNHFTVSVQKRPILATVNRFEVEAIRPHVTGYFKDMLQATARHPAMLLYLDNARSIGPGSRAGTRRSKGLNENYAREVMELHTLGVSGGYTQADVTALANIFTGWSLEQGKDVGGKLQYQFQPQFHEPGVKAWLGMRVPESGEQEGIAALDYLAAHPSTARHIATKFARYFISDHPPAHVISALADNFVQTKGHLGALAQTLINLPEAWSQPLVKFKDPYDYTVSMWRMLGGMPKPRQLFSGLAALDYRIFDAASPAGYANTAEALISPSAINKRLEVAYRFAQSVPATTDPMQLATLTLGPTLSDSTAQAIRSAATGRDGVALLLSSPEFLRR